MRITAVTLLVVLIAALSAAESDKPAFADTSNVAGRLAEGNALDSLIRFHLDRVDQDSLARFMQNLVDFKTRFLLAENRRDIAVWIQRQFGAFGFDDVVLDSLQNTVEFPLRSGEMRTTWQYNVVASLKGSHCTDTIFVLGAHYDCLTLGPGQDPFNYSPGANNNASGVAACLEIARLFKQTGFQPRYTISFAAFGSEEFMTMFAEGKSGSQHWVDQFKESGRHVALMIDNNQISYRPSADQWQLDFQNCPGSEWVTHLAHAAAEQYTRIVPVDTSDHINFSDVYYFWSAGYPAIFFEEYHFCPHTFTDKDIPENCDMEFCAEVAKISCAMLLYCNH